MLSQLVLQLFSFVVTTLRVFLQECINEHLTLCRKVAIFDLIIFYKTRLNPLLRPWVQLFLTFS
jgi:hypothetical protein